MKSIIKILSLGILVFSVGCGFAQDKANAQMSKIALENVLLETDLYTENKKVELLEIESEKKDLMYKVKNGDKRAELQMKELSERENMISRYLKEYGNSDLFSNFLKLNRIRPLPPCPPKKECRLEELRNMLTPGNLKNINVQVLDKNGKLLGRLEKNPLMIDKKTGVKLYQFQLNRKYSGPVTLNINRTTEDGLTENYSVSRILK